jgi:hypothetical protein
MSDLIAITSADLESMAERVPVLAVEHKLRVFEVLYDESPDIWVVHTSANIDEAVEIAAHTGATFISLDVSHFDSADLEDRLPDVEPGEATAATKKLERLIRAAAKHDGDVDHIFVRWTAHGMTYAWTLGADWVSALDAEIELATLAVDVDTSGRFEQRNERIAVLAAFLAASPELKAAPAHKRRSIAFAVSEESDDSLDEGMIAKAASVAVPQIERAALAKEMAMANDLDTLVDELKTTASWRAARTIPKRLDAANAFLIVKSGGYRLNALGLAQQLADATKASDETPVKMFSART